MFGDLFKVYADVPHQFVVIFRKVRLVRDLCERVPFGAEDAVPSLTFERHADPSYAGEEIDHREVGHTRRYLAAATEPG